MVIAHHWVQRASDDGVVSDHPASCRGQQQIEAAGYPHGLQQCRLIIILNAVQHRGPIWNDIRVSGVCTGLLGGML